MTVLNHKEKIMQRSILIFLCLLSPNLSKGQQITPSVLAASGAYGVNGAYNISWTLGETNILTLGQVGATMSQGFQQPNYFFDVLVEEPENGYEIKLFPNPTPDWITVEIKDLGNPLTTEWYDLFGRFLFRKTIESPRTGIDLSNLPGGTYLMKIVAENKELVGVWRVQKIW